MFQKSLAAQIIIHLYRHAVLWTRPHTATAAFSTSTTAITSATTTTAASTATTAAASTATAAATTTSARTRRSHHSRTWFHTHLSLIPNKSQTFICHILFHNHLIFNLLINTGPSGIPFHFLTISLSHSLTLSPSLFSLFTLLLFYIFTFLPFSPRHSSLHHQPLHRISHASVHIRRVHLQPVRHARHDALAQLAPCLFAAQQ